LHLYVSIGRVAGDGRCVSLPLAEDEDDDAADNS
jgi:hypothetical protein